MIVFFFYNFKRFTLLIELDTLRAFTRATSVLESEFRPVCTVLWQRYYVISSKRDESCDKSVVNHGIFETCLEHCCPFCIGSWLYICRHNAHFVVNAYQASTHFLHFNRCWKKVRMFKSSKNWNFIFQIMVIRLLLTLNRLCDFYRFQSNKLHNKKQPQTR